MRLDSLCEGLKDNPGPSCSHHHRSHLSRTTCWLLTSTHCIYYRCLTARTKYYVKAYIRSKLCQGGIRHADGTYPVLVAQETSHQPPSQTKPVQARHSCHIAIASGRIDSDDSSGELRGQKILAAFCGEYVICGGSRICLFRH